MMLPLTILEKMDAFILVKPSFYLKTLNFLNISNMGKTLNKSLSFVKNCQELCEKIKINIQDFVSFVP